MPTKSSPRACLLYVTARKKSEAVSIASQLLSKRIIACANIVGPTTSLYQWNNRRRHTSEYILLCKTTPKKSIQAMKIIAELHSYDCPCILEIPLSNVHPPFLDWLEGAIQG
jgi:periplasmic divalent cation tolerance protein